MTMEPVRWGILGAAKFAREHMAPAIHLARGADLVALGTSDPAKAAPFEALRPGLRVMGYDALLADPEVDAVYIPLPNHLHVEWTLKALDAGKHVLVEKPLGLRAADFDPVIARRDATGLVCAEAYMIVHHPQFQRARELVQGGAIGRLRHVEAVFSYNNAQDTANIRNDAAKGGGGLPDIGVYTFGAARFVTGEEPVAVPHATIDYENGVDTYVRCAVDFPSFRYIAMVSMRLFPRQEVVFHGDAGVLTLTCPFNAGVFGQAELRLEVPGMKVTTERFPGVNHYVLQAEAFGRSVREGAPYPCPLEFSRGTQAMIDMVYEAGGRP